MKRSVTLALLWMLWALAKSILLPPNHLRTATGIPSINVSSQSYEVGLVPNSLVRRAKRPLCSPPSRQQHQRRLRSAETYRNVTLQRRMRLPTNPDDIGPYVFKHTTDGSAQPFVFESGTSENPRDANTAIFESFKPDLETSYYTMRLRGCTTLAIISRKGFYLGHYWETNSFDIERPDDWLDYSDDDIFDWTVLEPLKKGRVDNGVTEQMSLTRFKETGHVDEHIKAYLIIPDNTSNEDPNGYRERWDQMLKVIKEIIPELQETGRIEEWKYSPVTSRDEGDLDNTPRGRILFKFDPKHGTGTKRTDPKVRLCKLWNEDREVHHDQWNA